MTKRTYIGVLTVALAVVLAAGGLLASNMGFKLNYPLNAPQVGVSATGTNTLALPDNRQAGINTANALLTDMVLANVLSVSKLIEATDAFQTYTGRRGSPGADFPLATGEGYIVKMATTQNYIVVGSHDPSFAHQLNAPGGGSATGTNVFSYPYHSTAATSNALLTDIGLANVLSVSKLVRATDAFQTYTGRRGSPGADFALVPGEAYIVKMAATVNYIPSHY
jgi:hypothetical protein